MKAKNRLAILMAAVCLLPMLSACSQTGTTTGKEGGESSVSSKETSKKTQETESSGDTSSKTEESKEEKDKEGTKTVEDESSEEASSGAGSSGLPVAEPTVRMAEWNSVNWTKYESAYFTLSIPDGWVVEWNGDVNGLFWRARSTDGKEGIFYQDHRYCAKDANAAAMTGNTFVMPTGTVQNYFDIMFSGHVEYFDVKNSCVPANRDLLQAIRPRAVLTDYQSMYALFKDSDVGEGEGIYSALIYDTGDVWNGGINYGMWEVDFTSAEYAQVGQLVNWKPVFAQIASSFAYTEFYMQQFRAAMGSTSDVLPNNDNDVVMEAFEERSKSDTIIQEKRSDMIGEYERVYDNNDGQIYRAYNGFLEDIGGSEQSRYTSITDSQYADGFVGWIDKD